MTDFEVRLLSYTFLCSAPEFCQISVIRGRLLSYACHIEPASGTQLMLFCQTVSGVGHVFWHTRFYHIRPASATFRPYASGINHINVMRDRLVSHKGRVCHTAFGARLVSEDPLLQVSDSCRICVIRGRLLSHVFHTAAMFLSYTRHNYVRDRFGRLSLVIHAASGV